VAPARTVLLLLLASAFGVVEAAVVVGLRHIADPTGAGQNALVPLPPGLLRLEQVREAATLVLLVSAAGLAGSSRLARAAAFLVLFGVWDLVYYLVLRLVLGWPARLTDWDVLFLLPVPWYAPVYAPVVVAATMLGCGLVVLHEIHSRGAFEVRAVHVAGVAAGALAILASFILPGLRAVERDAYWLAPLVAGEVLGLVAFAGAWRRTRRIAGRPAGR